MAHVADLEKDKFDSNGFIKVAVQGSSSYQNSYGFVHDGTQWRFQLGDANGKAINLDHTYYSASEITAMGSSTDINLWLSAYNDSMLIKKYVSSYNDQYEEVVYYQHPSLTSGKCLKLIHQYSTENSVKVVKSISASVSDWTFESALTGTISITNGTITSPSTNSSIAVGTDICTLTIADTTAGSATIALSGTSASFYRLSDGSSTGSTLTHDSTKSYVLETASDFSGSTYSHSVTVTVTSTNFDITDSVNIATTSTFVAAANFENLKCIAGPNNHASTGSAVSGAYMEVGKGLFSNQTYLEDLSSSPKTVSFWLKAPQIAVGKEVNLFGETSGWRTRGAHISNQSTGYNVISLFNADTGTTYSQGSVTAAVFPVDTWIFVSIVFDTNISASHCYINSSSTFSNTAHAFNSNTTSPTNAFISGSSLAISTAYFLGSRSYDNGIYPTSSSASNFDSSSVVEIDEFTVFNKELTVTEAEELYNSYETLDATTHSAASDLFRYIRFGDGTEDTESVVKCEIDTSFVLDKDSGATSTYQHNLSFLEAPYLPAAGSFANNKYFKGSTATGSTDGVRDLVLNGTNQNPVGDNASLPALNDAWSMSMWLQVPSVASTYDSIIAFSGTDTRNHFKLFHLFGKLTGSFAVVNGVIDINMSAFASSDYGTWKHIVLVKKAITPGNPNYNSSNSTYTFQIYMDGVAQNPTNGFSNGSLLSTSWDSESVSEFFISGPSRSFTTSANWATGKAGRQWKIDELATYSKELDQSEVNAIYNSGQTHDLTALNSAYNLKKYFRFGDHASDVATAGSIKCYDEVNDTVYFEDNNGSIEQH